VHVSTNFCAVRLLYWPLLIQNSLVYRWNLGERRLIDLRLAGRPDDRFEHIAHLERVRVLLIEEDVAPGNRRLVEMPDQRLVLQRQLAEAVGIELHDRASSTQVEEVFAIAGRLSRRRLRRRG
jgi:hypothetical protein